ncbi:MAG: hypothetical protein HYZ01_00960 [Ignavibacteriales bacterium]|nr:hypothetical protein [Ignavibacteriales bacterium]
MSLVAPLVFKQAPSPHFAGTLMSSILHRYSGIFIANAMFLILTFSFQALVLPSYLGLKLRLAMGLVSLALVIAVYDKYVLARKMVLVQERMAEASSGEFVNHDDRREFSRLHRRSMLLFLLNFVLGVVVIVVLMFNV